MFFAGHDVGFCGLVPNHPIKGAQYRTCGIGDLVVVIGELSSLRSSCFAGEYWNDRIMGSGGMGEGRFGNGYRAAVCRRALSY